MGTLRKTRRSSSVRPSPQPGEGGSVLGRVCSVLGHRGCVFLKQTFSRNPPSPFKAQPGVCGELRQPGVLCQQQLDLTHVPSLFSPRADTQTCCCKTKMETMHELIPFAKEMLSQKPNRKMVKLYMLGSVLAFFGVVIGLVETVCSPFSSEGRLDEEEDKSKPAAPRQQRLPQKREDLVLDKGKEPPALQRALVTRHHAS